MTESSAATARLQSRDGADVLLEGVSVAGAVAGLILEVSVEQRFRNPSERNIEIVYTFPLPGGAVLLGVDVRLGERQLTCAVAEKRQAAQAYEDSLPAGDAAFLRKEDVLSADDDWLYCDSYGGMTPSGLHKLLRALPRAQWPGTYAELRRKGLGVALVDWLDLAVGDAGDERSLIAAFLFAISLHETRAAMLDASGRAPSPGVAALKLIGRLLPRRAADDTAVDLELAARSAAQLAGMTATSWPPCVFALEPEAACA